MKFGVSCDVEGRTYLENGATIQLEGMRYTFYVQDIKEPLIIKVRIISDVDDPSKYSFHRSETAKDGTYTVTQNFEEHIQKRLIQQLQTLESLLGVVGNIKRIYWNKATFEYYPETEEEFKRINVMPAFFFMHEIPMNDPAHIPNADLKAYLEHIDTFEGLAVPMSFYREAKIEYGSGRYINCFFNSYFIIEGLFGNGKWRKEAIIAEFTKSQVFSGFVQQLLNEAEKITDPAEGWTKAQIEEELNKRSQPYTVEGLVKLIVETRGRLHHFSFGSTQQQGTPFNHLEYKRIALMGFTLAGNAIIHYIQEELGKKTP